ncbi:MAG: hypothetical protein ACI31R_05645 [Bacilli bacterium]
MVDIEELIKKINRRMTPKEAYELNKTVIEILKSDKYTKEYKDKLKSDAMLEPLSMLASCYEEDTQ